MHTDSSNKTEKLSYYEKDLAFLGSLLPGIIHNMSTPLSGVMGATQLLEMRASSIEQAIMKLQEVEQSEQCDLEIQLQRNRANYEIIARNARRLSDILQILVHRINRSSSEVEEYYSLNDLVQNELLFLDANLNFKHKVRKNLSLQADISSVKYIYAHVAMVIDEYVNLTQSTHDFKQGMIEMDFSTTSSENSLSLLIISRYRKSNTNSYNSTDFNSYLDRLKEENWLISFEETDTASRLTLTKRQTR